MTRHDLFQALSIIAVLGAVSLLALALPKWASLLVGFPVLMWGSTALDRDPVPIGGITRWPLETALVAQLIAVVCGFLGWRWLGLSAECFALAGVVCVLRHRAADGLSFGPQR